MLTVIVPVYLGAVETRRCLESVFRARCDVAYELVAIDDASPDAQIRDYLDELARAGRLRLIRHAVNRGFVASVNDGMREAEGRDVVLLNSDTEVAHGWLDRLAACVSREARAGTVTPFSNNATICSYPRPHVSNALPTGVSTAELDVVFAAANSGRAVDIPTAVGFCMYITAECRAEVGLFDEEAFGRGYGEEVDFCLRAAREGYRNLLAADTFVFHEGEVSFRDSSRERKLAAQAIVDARYPEFQTRLREFLDREPTRPLRRAVDLARLRVSPRPRVLLIAPAGEGAARSRADEHVALLQAECEVLLLLTDARCGAEVRWMREGEDFEARFDATQHGGLLALLREAGVGRVHVHQLHGPAPELPDFAKELGVPFEITPHVASPAAPGSELDESTKRETSVAVIRTRTFSDCVATAWQILRDSGPRSLATRVARKFRGRGPPR